MLSGENPTEVQVKEAIVIELHQRLITLPSLVEQAAMLVMAVENNALDVMGRVHNPADVELNVQKMGGASQLLVKTSETVQEARRGMNAFSALIELAQGVATEKVQQLGKFTKLHDVRDAEEKKQSGSLWLVCMVKKMQATLLIPIKPYKASNIQIQNSQQTLHHNVI